MQITKLLGVAFAYYLAGRLGLATPFYGSQITLFWLPTGIAVAALLRWGFSLWPGIYIGSFMVNLAVGGSYPVAAEIAVGNTLAPIFTVWLLKRSHCHLALDQQKDILLLCLASALGMLISACNGVATLWLAGAVSSESFLSAVTLWWMGDSVGVLLAAPLLLHITHDSLKDILLKRREILVWVVLTVVLGWLALVSSRGPQTLPLVFLTLPMVVWAALRFGLAGGSFAALLLSLMAAFGASQGGPFSELPQQQELFLVWAYMVTLVLACLMVTALLVERQSAEHALEAAAARYRATIDASPVPLAINDTQGNITYLNNAFVHTLGYTLEDIPTLADWWPRAYPDPQYRQWVADAWRHNLDESKIAGTPFTPTEAIITCKNGMIRTFMVSVSSLEESFAGDHLVALYDITERKQAEEELKLASLIYLNSSEAMTVTDADTRILAVNKAFTEVTGYTEEEVIGKTPAILQSGRQDADFYRRMWDAINATGSWRGEIWNKRKNGEVYPEILTINTIYKEDASVHRRVALFTDISERKSAEAVILAQANYDELTQLPNRRLFHDRLEQEMRKSEREKHFTALLLIDLDRFKEVNDTLGHDVGDTLLVEAASRIKHCVRGYDTVARLGGDEFTVILSELNDFSDIGRIAQDIIDHICEPFVLQGMASYISASIGIALYPNDASNVTDLIKNADQAMYKAKAEGKSCFRYFTKAMQEASELRTRLGADLRNALAANQFEVHYQPIVDLGSGLIHKAEALIRWKHPEHGLINPTAFIPIAEDTGTIHDIGNWVFMQSAHQVKKLVAALGRDFQISVNKSPVQFKGVDIGHSHWVGELTAMGLPGNSIVVEITEGLLMEDDASITTNLLGFRDAGIQVAIDDFGTGYSSLSYLKKFDIDYLKIDQSFTRNLAPGAAEFALCEAIVVMAHKLGLKVIAEGVETELQRDLLEEMGCDYGQGYLFSRPVPEEELMRLLT